MLFDFFDSVGGFSLWRRDGDFVTLLLAEERNTDRRFVADLTCNRVGFDRTYDLVGNFLAIVQCNRAADFDCTVAFAGFDDVGVLQDVLKLSDAAFYVALFFACSVVFSIFTEITVVAGVGNLFSNFAASAFQFCELGFEFGLALVRQMIEFLHDSLYLIFIKRRP